MSISTSPALRCPRCSAHVVAGGDWCTLCYADLRPPPPEPPVPVEPSAPVAPPGDREDATPTERPAPRRGKHARATPVSGADAVAAAAHVEAVADQLLAELAATETKNPLGPLAAVVDSPGKRVALMIGGAAAAIILLLVVMAGFGALL